MEFDWNQNTQTDWQFTSQKIAMAQEGNRFEMDDNRLRNLFKFGVPRNMLARGMKNGTPHSKLLDKEAPPPSLAECGKQREPLELVIHTPSHVKGSNI